MCGGSVSLRVQFRRSLHRSLSCDLPEGCRLGGQWLFDRIPDSSAFHFCVPVQGSVVRSRRVTWRGGRVGNINEGTGATYLLPRGSWGSGPSSGGRDFCHPTSASSRPVAHRAD